MTCGIVTIQLLLSKWNSHSSFWNSCLKSGQLNNFAHTCVTHKPTGAKPMWTKPTSLTKWLWPSSIFEHSNNLGEWSHLNQSPQNPLSFFYCYYYLNYLVFFFIIPLKKRITDIEATDSSIHIIFFIIFLKSQHNTRQF